jgi:(2R)-3-sulfolactate dehydrogenase (NADP+)
MYCTMLANGRADGKAVPAVSRQHKATCVIDAHEGLAYAACELAITEAMQRARDFGVAFAGVTNSHHCGALSLQLLPAAKAGLVAFGFTNSPAAVNAWGGKRPLFGTNPIAAVFPRDDGEPIVIDTALTTAARGKIMVAAQNGKPIPEGWALNRDGKPTTDAAAALEGSMLPLGGVEAGAKGAALVLLVELLCCALTGAAFGFEADSFFVDAGNRPHLGQTFFVVDPGAAAGSAVYHSRMRDLVTAMLAEPGVRLPGANRAECVVRAARDGVELPEALLAKLRKLAGETG